jgi:hypothetical protein
MADHQDA